MNSNEIISLFSEWNNALQTGDPKQVTQLYASNAVLLPTISNQARCNHNEIEDYFVTFLANAPQGRIDWSHVRIFEHIATHSGVYTFTFKDGSVVQARFSFVYQWNGKRWLILEHHSSRMPETVCMTA